MISDTQILEYRIHMCGISSSWSHKRLTPPKHPQTWDVLPDGPPRLCSWKAARAPGSCRIKRDQPWRCWSCSCSPSFFGNWAAWISTAWCRRWRTLWSCQLSWRMPGCCQETPYSRCGHARIQAKSVQGFLHSMTTTEPGWTLLPRKHEHQRISQSSWRAASQSPENKGLRYADIYIYRLVGGLEHFLFFHILGMSSSQLTFIFFRRVETTKQYLSYYISIRCCFSENNRRPQDPIATIIKKSPNFTTIKSWRNDVGTYPALVYLPNIIYIGWVVAGGKCMI